MPRRSASASAPTRRTRPIIRSRAARGGSACRRGIIISLPAPNMSIRKAYRDYIIQIQTLAGIPDAAAKADAIIALETRLSQDQWTPERRRDPQATYNPMSRAQLTALAPQFEWQSTLAHIGLGTMPTVVVREPSAVAAAGKRLDDVPLATWKDYLTFRFLSDHAQFLPKAFDDARFGFYSHTLQDVPAQAERWKRGVRLLNADLGEAVGQIYARKHWTPETERQMNELIGDLRASYGDLISHASWMDEATRKEALAKLASFDPRIGHPVKYIDYSSLKVSRARPARQCDGVERFRMAAELSRAPQAGRPQPLGHERPGGERLLQPADEPGRPSRPRSSSRPSSTRGRPGGQLRRDRRDDRPRNGPRLRRRGPPVRRAGPAPRLVDQGIAPTATPPTRRLWSSSSTPMSRSPEPYQGPADARRKSRRSWRARSRLCRLSPLRRPPRRAAGDRRLYRRPALLHRLCAELAGQGPRGRAALAAPLRPAQPGGISGQRHRPQFDPWYAALVKPGDKLYLAARSGCTSGSTEDVSPITLAPAGEGDHAEVVALANQAYRGAGGWNAETGLIEGERSTVAFLRADLRAEPEARLLIHRDPEAAVLGFRPADAAGQRDLASRPACGPARSPVAPARPPDACRRRSLCARARGIDDPHGSDQPARHVDSLVRAPRLSPYRRGRGIPLW